MEPTPKPHVSHWIAWSVIILVVGVAGFFGWRYFDEITTIYGNTFVASIRSYKKTTTATTATTTTDVTADWKTYTNTEFGFTFTFNDNIWKNYVVVEKTNPDDPTIVKNLYFAIPTTDKTWTDVKTGYAAPFAISVYKLADYNTAVQKGEITNATLITKNTQYAFTYGTWQATPSDLESQVSHIDVKGIMATFKFTK